MRYGHLLRASKSDKFSNEEKQKHHQDLQKHIYRIRRTPMLHFGAALNTFMGGEQPGPDKPWAVETFYTHDETEKAFQEGLKYFNPQPK